MRLFKNIWTLKYAKFFIKNFAFPCLDPSNIMIFLTSILGKPKFEFLDGGKKSQSHPTPHGFAIFKTWRGTCKETFTVTAHTFSKT